MAKKSKVVSKKKVAKPAPKKATPKKSSSKKVATKKVSSKKSPSKKAVTKKAAPKKVATKKAVVKKASKKVVKKVAPKASSKAASKAGKKVVKKAVKKVVAKKAIKKVSAKKVVAKSAAPKKIKEVVKSEVKKAKVLKPVPTKDLSKKDKNSVKVTTPSSKPSASSNKGKDSKPVTKAASLPKPSKQEQKSKAPIEEKVDPLHAKAAKAIKELEETMDLSKVKPRLQAGSPPPKPIRHKEPPLKLVEPTNTQKIKYSLEFEFRSSPKILFNSISDASGLAGWFADEVQTKDDIYTFYWDQGSSQAKMVAMQDLRLIRFQWLEDTDGTYFQFEIKEDDITADIALIITDFALKGEKDTQIRLWESQIQQLKMFVGSL